MSDRENPPAAATLVRAAFAGLARAGIEAAPLHGLERWPEIGRDVDLLVAPGKQAQALSVLKAVMEGAGYAAACPPNAFGPCLIGFKDRDWHHGLELHLLPGVRWRWTTFVVRPSLRPAQPFPTDPWASFAKRILLPLVAGGTKGRDKVLGEPLPVGEELEAIRAAAAGLLPAGMLDALLAAIRERDAEGLAQLRSPLRKALSRTRPASLPFRMAAYFVRGLVTKFRALTQAITPVVAVCGLDDSKVSALKEALQGGPPSVFMGWDFSASVWARRKAAGIQKIPVCFGPANSLVPGDVAAVLALGAAKPVGFSGLVRSIPENAAIGEVAEALRRLIVEAFLQMRA